MILQLDDLVGDHETQSSDALALYTVFFVLVEPPEGLYQPLYVLGVDPDPVVYHLELQVALHLRELDQQLHHRLLFDALSVLEGVLEQVYECLLQPLLVLVQHQVLVVD